MKVLERLTFALPSLVAFLVALASSFTASAEIPASERQALLDIYQATGGSTAWANRSGWQGPAGTECTWFGVTCDGGGTTVVGLSLSTNNLVGGLPTSLGNLSGLQRLDLRRNSLTGSIPSTISQLQQLKSLDLESNRLQGGIPVEMYQLPGLEELSLGSNEITGPISPSIGKLTGLRVLSLLGNNLGGYIPGEICDLENLEVLSLDGAGLIGAVPEAIGRLKKLRYLSLNANRLNSQLPPDLWTLSNLQTLSLSGNVLFGVLPADVKGLTSLRHLRLSSNYFSGPIPGEIGQLSFLQTLDLERNNFAGSIPSALGSLSSLQFLQLNANKLEGQIPDVIGDLEGLTWLRLNSNILSGEVPRSVQRLSRIGPGSIDVRYNMLRASDAGTASWLETRQRGWLRTQVLPPHKIVVASVSSSSVVLRWESLIDSFPARFEVSGDSGSGPVVLKTSDSGARELALANLLPDTTYTFTIRTKAGGHISYNLNDLVSEPSEPVTATTLPPPYPSVRADDVRFIEGDEGTSTWTWRVALSKTSPSESSVTWKTVEGTATAGYDFVSTGPSTLTFAPGETEKYVTVEILGDTLVEPDEVFYLELSEPVNVMVAPASGAMTIVDDDGPTLPPDPAIEFAGCEILGFPCTVRAKSKSGRTVLDWECEWRLDGVVKATGIEWTPELDHAGFYTILLQATNRVGVSSTTSTLTVRQQDPEPEAQLELLGGRFALSIAAKDHRTGKTGAGDPIRRNDLFGYFSMPELTSNPENPEVFVKMLDGRSVNGSFWIFFGGLTDLEYTLRVRDAYAGTTRTYLKPFGTSAGGFDVGRGVATEGCPGEVDGEPFDVPSVEICAESGGSLCLDDGRFRVVLEARDPRTAAAAEGLGIRENDLFGYFAIPGLTGDASNPEVFVKVLDGRAVNGYFWVFYGGLTDLEYSLTITDTAMGVAKRYLKAAGSACGGFDVDAF